MACGCQAPVTRHPNLLADAPSSGNHCVPAGHLVPEADAQSVQRVLEPRERVTYSDMLSPANQLARLINSPEPWSFRSRERQPVGLTERCERVEGVEEQRSTGDRERTHRADGHE